MAFKERNVNKIRGWYYIIMSGMFLGLFSGLIIGNYIIIDEIQPHEYILLTTAIGTIIGIIVAWIIDRKKDLGESWQVLERSEELDSFYRRTESAKPNKEFIKSLKGFSNKELIVALWFREYELTEHTVVKLIEEIQSRSITKHEVERIYKTSEFYKDINLYVYQCPCCDNKEHLIWENGKIKRCQVCGYDSNIDNPKSIINRIRWKIGMHSLPRLAQQELLEMIGTIK